MNCQECRKKIPDLLQGGLADGEAARCQGTPALLPRLLAGMAGTA